MIKYLISAILGLLTGTIITTLKKDKVIIELKRNIMRLTSYETYADTFRQAYDHGYNRGWLDRNISPEPPARWNR
jgi:hypothetical protein